MKSLAFRCGNRRFPAGVEGAGESPAEGRMPIAVDAVFDSVSVANDTFKDRLEKDGIIFCPIDS
jgi:Fe-S cluster assembly protein SufB